MISQIFAATESRDNIFTWNAFYSISLIDDMVDIEENFSTFQ